MKTLTKQIIAPVSLAIKVNSDLLIPLYICISIACLFLILLSTQSIDALYNWHPEPEKAQYFVQTILKILIIQVIASSLIQAPKYKEIINLILGIGAITWLVNWQSSLLLFLFVSFWFFLFPKKQSTFIKLLLLSGFIFALYQLRLLNIYSFGFWWLYVNWIRFISIAIDRTASNKKEAFREYLLSLQLIFSTPFLLGPLAMEWISLRYLKEKAFYVQTVARVQKGAMLCIWSIALIYCYQCFSQTSLMQLAWNGAMLGEKQGHGLHHLYAGFMFFLTRFWILGALTALAAGVWHTLGCEFKYDCNSPLLAKNTLDFWRRYKNYSYDFLYRAVYLPSALSVSKHKSWQFSIGAGVTSVLLAVALVHVINPVPIPGFPFDHSYSWRGAIQHGFVMGIFILITQLFSHANNVILKYLRLEKTNWAVALSNLAQISFTCVTTSWYFYSAYAQMWRGWTIKEYFISILSF